MHRVRAIPNCNCLLPVHYNCSRYLLSLSLTLALSLTHTHKHIYKVHIHT